MADEDASAGTAGPAADYGVTNNCCSANDASSLANNESSSAQHESSSSSCDDVDGLGELMDVLTTATTASSSCCDVVGANRRRRQVVTTAGAGRLAHSCSLVEDGGGGGCGSSAGCPVGGVRVSKSLSHEDCVKRRTRSLNAPSPVQQFGPCGRIMKNSAMVMTIQDPASQRLTWYKPPLTVLVIKKVRDAAVIPPFIQLVKWFINEKRMVVFVESAVMEDPLLTQNPAFGQIHDKLMTFSESKDDLTDKIDFVVCLGGDGTLLYASSLFQQSVPPIMAFHLGSLGFLTPFQFQNFEQQVTHVLEGHAALTLRSRLRCILIKKEEELNNVTPGTNQLVLNEVVIDRGPSPYLSNIDLYLDGKLITSVQGDGLLVSTPTGSTAYAVAAGASMIHPSVPAVMVTPICPHSLSFRPIVVPAGVELKIAVSPDSRNTAWVSFDGRKRQELMHGDSLRVNTSIYPIPSICAQDQIADWFDSLAECLHWNVRKKQKHLDELTDLSGGGDGGR